MANTGTKLPYNPLVLEWARLRTGMTVDDVAKKLRVTVQKIKDWESGASRPTVRQGRKLAEYYNRHFLEFFSNKIPEVKGVELVPDYRTFRGKHTPSRKENRAMEAVQEWAEEQRLNALALIEELGDQPPIFSDNLRFEVDRDVEAAAAISRDAIGFGIQEQFSLRKSMHYKFPEILRDKIEEMGVLVLKKSEITKQGVRGVCLFVTPLPVIVFGSESPGAQAFTLAHEFGHVLLGASGISGQPHFGDKSGHKEIEDWCNRFASAFLAPCSSIEEKLGKADLPANKIETTELKKLAEMFAISPHAMLIRLVDLGYVQRQFYWKTMLPIFRKEEEEYKSYVRSKYYGKRFINAQGRYYTGLVMTAWSGGQISAHNAAEYMGIKNINHLRDIRKDYKF